MIVSDWAAYWTVEQIEKELKGFKLKGEGWYSCPTLNESRRDHMLITKLEHNLYKVRVWNGFDPRPSIKHLLEMVEHGNEK